ncbi:MAG TPA: glycosyltransferase family 39 protein [Terriglobales bacterium]|nr:glycosyltransferase family 39 protein [Terriglobales bacterium]
MRQFVRRHLGFFLAATAAAFALRLLFLWKFSFVAGDSLIYGDIAKNWLQHGVFAMTEDGLPVPTCIRLPGYPAFVALIWKFAGLEHYQAVMVLQMFFDVGTCYLVAALARLVLWERAAMAAFLLYALNPFTANYVATPLTETLAVFFTALALLFAVEGLTEDSLRWWIFCGLAIAAGILLRPDAGILLAAIGGYLLIQLFRRPDKRRVISAGVLVAVVSLAPLVPWTLRNWRVFHVFQPLAPRYANNPWEFVPAGFNRWIKTWLVDYVSVDDIYWHVPGDPIEIAKLPPRAFGSADERTQTERLFAAYNATCDPVCRMTPELDSQFASLTAQRIHHAPLRYYLGLPLARVTDMWLRPRTEALPLDSHWWRFRRDPKDALLGVLLGAINLAYLIAALTGAARKRVAYAGFFVLWIALRCAFLATLENPEPRYTLECFPVVCVFAAANVSKKAPVETQHAASLHN